MLWIKTSISENIITFSHLSNIISRKFGHGQPENTNTGDERIRIFQSTRELTPTGGVEYQSQAAFMKEFVVQITFSNSANAAELNFSAELIQLRSTSNATGHLRSMTQL